ncbi:hypothetical protein [Deinococcus roseus]|uniref:Lipoprotein n=1 Tax=Deinococcus roseus TaxID=392414 RepID=A0ABQ2DA14_9DEIO|nr:hypothetical protein [Deinococcus roseus]GGJ48605.1 hypothetical protein GCM10008938_38260 [Deinococcus roseus]
MKMLKVGCALLVGVGLLSACGLVAKAIPPIELANKNALNLKDEKIAVEFAALPTLAKQDVNSSGQITATFGDAEKPDTKGFTPGAIDAALKLVAVDVSGLTCNAPAAFDLKIEATGKVFETGNPNIVADASASTTVNITKTGEAYTLKSGSEIKMVFGSNLLNIVTSGGNNTAQVNYTVSSTNDQLAGCRIEFTVGDQIVVLRDWH